MPTTTGRPSVIVLPVPRPYKIRIAKEAINRSLPDAIAAFVAWLVNDSGWEIRRARHRRSVPAQNAGRNRSDARIRPGAGSSRGRAFAGWIEILSPARGNRDACARR